jgi:hypothetical protein
MKEVQRENSKFVKIDKAVWLLYALLKENLTRSSVSVNLSLHL